MTAVRIIRVLLPIAAVIWVAWAALDLFAR